MEIVDMVRYSALLPYMSKTKHIPWTGNVICLLAATILESFIQAQKMSVRRALRRGFRKYLADPSDFFALLLVELQKMVR